MKAAIVSFTAQGAALAARIGALYPGAEIHAPRQYGGPGTRPLEDGIGAWTGRAFASCALLVYVGAVGIAVRAIAPYVRTKTEDPAVLCVDDTGRFVIPLLSGHIGGANRYARQVARHLDAQAVITTATDRNGVFAVDTWAVEQGLLIPDSTPIKRISGALLNGEPVGLYSEFPIQGSLPAGIVQGRTTRCGIAISLAEKRPFPHTLRLIPCYVAAGIGCRRGTGADQIERLLRRQMAEHGLPLEAVRLAASIHLKAKEPGLLELCERLRIPLVTFSAEALMAQEGDFTPSARVQAVTGADNVCERAAVAAGGTLFSPKAAAEGVTVALARMDGTITFGEGV